MDDEAYQHDQVNLSLRYLDNFTVEGNPRPMKQ